MAQVVEKSEYGRFPPGHFYSPIPAVDEVLQDEGRIWDGSNAVLGVDMNELGQLELLEKLAFNYNSIPFTAKPKKGLYYFYERGSYFYSDAIFLHLMLRHLKPRNVIEVGSGSSSCVMLDTNRHFLDGKINLTFIDPYPNKIPSIPQGSHGQTQLISRRVQDVDIETFQILGEGDILFIDSTHVAKTGSDVNDIFFRLLPSIRSGVYIHFHDIFFPFEYPKYWVTEHGRYWNEIYLLRSFLQFNSQFKIKLMNTFLTHKHAELMRQKMPLCFKNRGGSIWIQKQ